MVILSLTHVPQGAVFQFPTVISVRAMFIICRVRRREEYVLEQDSTVTFILPLKFSSVSENNSSAILRRFDRQHFNGFLWTMNISDWESQVLNWYRWVMSSVDCTRGVKKMGVVLFRLNKYGRTQQLNRTCCFSVNHCRILWPVLLTSSFSSHNLMTIWSLA